MIVPTLLRRRSARAASPSPTRRKSDSETLQRVLRDRSQALWDSLQGAVEAAGTLCETDCAGITRLEPLPDGTETLRWIAATGPLRLAIGEPMCLDRNLRSVLRENKPRLVFRPHRLFSQIAESCNVAEALLVPWIGEIGEIGEPSSGILWVIQRHGAKRLDPSKVRVLLELAAFASRSIAQAELESLCGAPEQNPAAAQVAHQLAHAVNDPLRVQVRGNAHATPCKN
jgi:hypothetical protein